MVFNVKDSGNRKTVKEFPKQIKKLEHVFIPMSDGSRLAADIWLPEDAWENPVPAVLEYLPYRKNDFTAIRDSIRHPYFAGNGYASIRVDIRGAGDSDGILLDEYTKQEQDDALEVIDWIVSQPWATDSVGMIGKSWGGFNGLQIAARENPHLKTIITLCSTDDRYADDVHYRGGNVLASDMLWWASTMFVYNARPQDPAIVGESWRKNWFDRLENTPPFVEEWMVHQRRDDYWKHGSVCEDYSKITIPVFAVGGWQDGYTDAIFRMMENLPNENSKGLIGPWAHEYPEVATPEPAIGFLQECLRWWDQWLKGTDTGVKEDPKLISWIQESELPAVTYDQRPGKWVADEAWPSPNVSKKKLYLKENELGETADETGNVFVPSVQEQGMYTGLYCPFGQPGDAPGDQRLDNGKSVVFTSSPLEETIEMLGHPVFHVEVSSDQPQASMAVRLCDKAPTGESTLISWGMLNLTHRDSHEFPEHLEPGKKYQVSIQLDALGQEIPKGHQLELAVSPTSWPQAWPSPKPVILTIHTGEKTSLELPVRTPQEQDDSIQFERPETAEVMEREIIRTENRTRNVINDVTTGVWRLEDFSDEGERKLPSNGIQYGSKNKNTFTIKEKDPLSAHVQCEWELEVKRDDWQTKVESHSEMSSDEKNFYLINTLVAFENGEEVFRKMWEKEVPRDFQ
ncbi:CocE/NonD family hydrolase [Planomicrobium sp. YIM 101495]|uniref:CocE/NonD family hydrolase n=1 Tax=Planomicrobium sp. YIM 101495 TaxID=2665160 RepID=UPI0012B8D406|nr:CocE/NonD family hydrolase [Planomicrobium sp. YIM 101495]MTD30732.1 CocE/NonD family hydrolase [Planomicrobium sp. YIM 101495]